MHAYICILCTYYILWYWLKIIKASTIYSIFESVNKCAYSLYICTNNYRKSGDIMDKMHKAKAISYINMYNKENYVNISIRVKPEVKQEIVNNAEIRKMSLASFIVKSCKYIIDNNIQLK